MSTTEGKFQGNKVLAEMWNKSKTKEYLDYMGWKSIDDVRPHKTMEDRFIERIEYIINTSQLEFLRKELDLFLKVRG